MARKNKGKAKVRLGSLDVFAVLIWINQAPACYEAAASEALTAESSPRTIQKIQQESSESSSEAESLQVTSKSFEGATNFRIIGSDLKHIQRDQINFTFAVHLSNGKCIHCAIDIG